jgi:hypothetical protein
MSPTLPPNFFIVAGMPRSGTTFIYHNFQKHPFVFCPFRKETNFFTVNFSRGINWYQELYKEIQPGQIGLDASPSYFLDPRAVTRIQDLLPHAKIILGIRNPVDFSLSLYNQLITHLLKDRPSFETFIQDYDYPFGDQVINIQLSDNFIVSTIDLYRQAFGANLLLYQFDYFQTDPLIVSRSIENHLGLPAYFDETTFDAAVINASNRKNISLVTYILSREKLINTLGAVLPRRLLQKMRLKFDKLSKRGQKPNQISHSLQDQQIAQKVFAPQEEVVRALFADHPIILGDGSPVAI